MNIVLQIIIGYLLADIITGGFHWFEDTYMDYCISTPFLSMIAKDNELHHYFPRSIIAFSLVDNMYASSVLTVIVFGLLYCCIKKSLFQYKYIFITLAFFSIIVNVLHRLSHMRDCENHWLILFLQSTGILCSHTHHSMHHKNVSEKYCVISAYNNYLLDHIYFWRGLEQLIYLFFHIKPSRKPSYEDYSEIHNYMHKNAKYECPDTPTREDITILKQLLHKWKNECSK